MITKDEIFSQGDVPWDRDIQMNELNLYPFHDTVFSGRSKTLPIPTDILKSKAIKSKHLVMDEIGSVNYLFGNR